MNAQKGTRCSGCTTSDKRRGGRGKTLNLSGLIFLAAIPPERVGGSLNMYYIGCGIMAVGLLPALLIRDKYNYKRVAFDRASKRTSSLPEDAEAGDTENKSTPDMTV